MSGHSEWPAGGHPLELMNDGRRRVTVTYLPKRKAVLMTVYEADSSGSYQAAGLPREFPLGLFVYRLGIKREDVVEAVERDSIRFGFRAARRAWGRSAAGLV